MLPFYSNHSSIAKIATGEFVLGFKYETQAHKTKEMLITMSQESFNQLCNIIEQAKNHKPTTEGSKP